ncbi:MAG: zinc ribbon domain-containing protein [Caldilineaceae bacterium]|nr:zinc ribbon domain-containing protein [Caldilineaceae bacterium]
MPIYEFVCESCTYEFEKIVSFSATVAPTCPVCAGDEVKRRMSKPAIHFKGSGWYITDSKADHKKSNGNGASSEKSKDGESIKSTDEDGVAAESKVDGVKNEAAKGDSAKSEPVKSESSTKATVKSDG